MADPRAYSQNRSDPYFTQHFWMSNELESTHAVPNYKRRTQNQSYYLGHQIMTRHTRPLLNRFSHENAATAAQIEAHEDAVTTKAWHDEWEVEPDGFGTPRPLLLLNRPTNIDSKNRTWPTKSVYLCHWDRGHEPDGVIAQRLAKTKRSREKEHTGAYMGSKQDMRRKRVKQAARNVEVIDLTRDDTVGESKFQSYAGGEDVENHHPEAIAQSWRTSSWTLS